MPLVRCTSALNQGGWRAEVGQVFGSTHPFVAAYPANFSTTVADSSGGTVAATVASGVGKRLLTIPLPSLATGLGVSAVDLLTTYTVPYKFKILSLDFVTTVAGTGAAASQVFTMSIGATPTTGGVCTVTLASTATIGSITLGTAITALNTGAANSTISLKMAASGTVFITGGGFFLLGTQNMDMADAFATLLAI